MTKTIFAIAVSLALFSGCAYRSLTDTIESVYTDEVVVTPTSKNYKSAPTSSTKPILKDEIIIKSDEEKAKAKSDRIKREGYITSFTFDKDINLYLYNFKTTDTDEELVFFFDKKLPYSKDDLLEVDIKDNFLMNHKLKSGVSYSNQFTVSQKIKKLKKRRQNFKIHEAVEEKINTF